MAFVAGVCRVQPDAAAERAEILGVGEALHLVVRATRYGCLDADSGNYFRRAFTLLHKRYPRDPWTRKTPYWFKL